MSRRSVIDCDICKQEAKPPIHLVVRDADSAYNGVETLYYSISGDFCAKCLETQLNGILNDKVTTILGTRLTLLNELKGKK